MSEMDTGGPLLLLAGLLVLTYALSSLLEKHCLSDILSTLFLDMAMHYTPLGTRLLGARVSVSRTVGMLPLYQSLCQPLSFIFCKTADTFILNSVSRR